MTLSEGKTYLFRLKKVLAGKDFYLGKDLKLPTMHKGNAGASWTFYPDILSERSIIYSFGVGLDISFDLALIRTFDVPVHAFDPTPRSIQWLETRTDLSPKFIFHPTGAAAYDGDARFFAPQQSTHVSHTLLEGQYHASDIQVPVRRIATLMETLGHAHLDLLKLDIEGAEYDVIEDLLMTSIPIKQLLVEFHHRFAKVGIKKSKESIAKLRKAGFQIFHVSPSGEEVSFINRAIS